MAWTNIFSQTFSTTEGFKYKYNLARTLISAVDVKPVNCAFCLSFWVGVTLSIIFMDITFMSIFLFYVIKEK